MADTSAIWQQAAHTTYQHPAAQQEPYKIAKPLFLEKKSGQWPISRKMTRQKED